jgi:hypothetical protein
LSGRFRAQAPPALRRGRRSAYQVPREARSDDKLRERERERERATVDYDRLVRKYEAAVALGVALLAAPMAEARPDAGSPVSRRMTNRIHRRRVSPAELSRSRS